MHHYLIAAQHEQTGENVYARNLGGGEYSFHKPNEDVNNTMFTSECMFTNADVIRVMNRIEEMLHYNRAWIKNVHSLPCFSGDEAISIFENRAAWIKFLQRPDLIKGYSQFGDVNGARCVLGYGYEALNITKQIDDSGLMKRVGMWGSEGEYMYAEHPKSLVKINDSTEDLSLKEIGDLLLMDILGGMNTPFKPVILPEDYKHEYLA